MPRNRLTRSRLPLRSPSARQPRLRAALGNERGNLAASVVFIMFTTLILGVVTTSLIAALAASERTRDTVAANQAVSAVGGHYLAEAAAGRTPGDGELCAGTLCASVSAATAADGTLTVSVKAAAGDSSSLTRTLPVPSAGQPGALTGFNGSTAVRGTPAPAPEAEESDDED